MTVTIRRVIHDKEHPYVMTARGVAQNKAISYEALGMLNYLLSKPDDWIIGVDDLIRQGCGQDKAYRILKELKDAGHLVHVREKAAQGVPPMWGERVVVEQPYPENTDTVTPIPEMPDMAKRQENPPIPDLPDTAQPDTVKAGFGETALTNKDSTDQEILLSKERENARAHTKPDYGFKVDFSLIEKGGGSISYDDGEFLTTPNRAAFAQAAYRLFLAYLDALRELGRAPLGGDEAHWQKHQAAALRLALARITPEQVSRYVLDMYRGDDPYWASRPTPLSLKNVAENYPAWAAKSAVSPPKPYPPKSAAPLPVPVGSTSNGGADRYDAKGRKYL